MKLGFRDQRDCWIKVWPLFENVQLDIVYFFILAAIVYNIAWYCFCRTIAIAVQKMVNLDSNGRMGRAAVYPYFTLRDRRWICARKLCHLTAIIWYDTVNIYNGSAKSDTGTYQAPMDPTKNGPAFWNYQCHPVIYPTPTRCDALNVSSENWWSLNLTNHYRPFSWLVTDYATGSLQ